MTNLNWAQIVLIVLMGANMGTAIYLNGQVKKANKWSIKETLIYQVILFILLYYGGYFK